MPQTSCRLHYFLIDVLFLVQDLTRGPASRFPSYSSVSSSRGQFLSFLDVHDLDSELSQSRRLHGVRVFTTREEDSDRTLALQTVLTLGGKSHHNSLKRPCFLSYTVGKF